MPADGKNLTHRLSFHQVAKLLAERDAKEDELTTLLKLSAKDLWSHDLEQFEREWSDLLDADTVAQQKSLKAARLKGKPATKTKKKKYDSDDDDDDSEEEFEVKPKKTAPVKKVALKKVGSMVGSGREETKLIVLTPARRSAFRGRSQEACSARQGRTEEGQSKCISRSRLLR